MIETLRLQNFRSYKDSSFEFGPGVNIVVGPNASGKTNLLEAILVLASGSSFRARDIELVRFGANWSRLDGFFGRQSRTVKIKITGSGMDKEYNLDADRLKRLSLDRTTPAVLFEPNHLQLISRGPQFRRDYFDDILARSRPSYRSISRSYGRTLAQRNALLKQPPASAKKQLFAWNIRLSELGAQINAARRDLIAAANKTIPKSYNQIAGRRGRAKLVYESPFTSDNYSSRLLSKLEASTDLDFRRGFTAYGPHREDIILYLGGHPASAAASRGESRSLVLALKLFELKLLEASRGLKPLFLLDDVFSELDGSRRRHLVDHLTNYQSIITTTDADAVMEYFAGRHNLILI